MTDSQARRHQRPSAEQANKDLNDDLAQRIAALSPAKRALLELRLGQREADALEKPAIPPLRPVTREGPLPLSFAQERLWIIDQLQPGNAAYNVSVAYHVTGALDVTALAWSLNQIVRRHDVLRTTFQVVNGQPAQVIAPELNLTLKTLSKKPGAEPELEIQRVATQEAQRPFDLDSGPLLRALLLRLDKEEQALFLTMHHIVSDGWSMIAFNRELAALYGASTTGTPPSLSELPIQYADFAVWQRNWFQGDVLEEQLSYWKQRLGGDLPVLALPHDRPRPPAQSFRGGRQSALLPKHLVAGLEALSRQENVTLFMTLLAAFKTLLYRYSGQEDVVVGAPVANRTRAEVEDSIGFFVNTLVLRTDLSGQPTFRELLRRVRETTLQAQAHQDLPFEKLVEALQPQRDLSRNPLFQVMFAFQNAPVEALTLPGLSVRSVEVASQRSQFDLTLFVEETERGLKEVFEYNSDLFDADTVARMMGHLDVLLKAVVTDPDRRISDLPLLTKGELDQVLVTWNDVVTHPPSHPLHHLFETRVAQRPDAVAVILDGEHLTYRKLNQRANQLARYLERAGVEPESIVGICLERSLDLVVGILGILKAGGAYLPLDPTHPDERLAFILGDARTSLLLTQKKIVPRFSGFEAETMCLDTDWEAIARERGENLEARTSVHSLAYVIYTSGSTGQPKGVLVSHHNVTRLFEATQAWFDFDDRDVWSLFHTFAFDFSVWELWGALLYGGRLVVVPYWMSRSPRAFYDLTAKERVTVLNQTPSAFRHFMKAEELLGTEADLNLRLIIFGGEALDLQTLGPWFDRHGDRTPRLVNMYGITETTVHVTYRPLNVADLETPPASFIGRPIPDLKTYILDQHLQPLPVGVSGEIYVGGDGLSRGYLCAPALTASRFVPDPFSQRPGERLYRTGDLARYRPDGDIDYLGRADHQVKIRGFRIELGEIEAALSRHPAIREAAVLAREDDAEAKRLVAYLIVDEPAAFSSGEPYTFLQKQLPDYMLPSAFVALEAWPLTPNGKLDRQALPAPGVARPELDDAYVAPCSPLEEVLAEIWRETLPVEKVGVCDNFFELGGHSLLAIQIVFQIHQSLGVELTIQSLFRTPTVRGLASVLLEDPIQGPALERTAQVLLKIARLSPEAVDVLLTDDLFEE